MSVTIIPWIVVLTFGGIFVFAGIREYLHRRAHGAPEDPRAGFEFDEEAPSYEEPEPDPEDTTQEADTDTPPDAGRDAADDTPNKARAAPPTEAPTEPPHDSPGSAPETPNRNEAPK